MRLTSIVVKDVLPIKHFDVTGLSDVVVLAGPNGVGKTRLIDRLLEYFQAPQGHSNIRLAIEATCDDERRDWGKSTIDTSSPQDVPLMLKTLQKSRRRSNWESCVLNFESDRTIQQIVPFNFSWDAADPWYEDIGWNVGLRGLRNRFQDTLHSIFRKVHSQQGEIAKKVNSLIKVERQKQKLGQQPAELISIDYRDFPDPIEPFKRAFSQLLAPKELLDPEPQTQRLSYSFDGHTLAVSSLSSGEREVVNIVFDFLLRNPKDCIVILDEPELHLHPELSYRLLQTLRTAGTNNQFIFCTHSPEIITASLEHSVIFIAPPKSNATNQAVAVTENDETHRALRLLGQSIGIVALGKRIVLIEGNDASTDKQVYGDLLRNRFPGLVLVAAGGKGLIRSFAALHREVLDRTLWGVEFFVLCDRDVIPPSRDDKELEKQTAGRLRLLTKYHIENYFLDENVLAAAFSDMEPEGSWLRSPKAVRDRLRQIAQDFIPYATALATAAYVRETFGNVDIMPKECQGKGIEELVSLLKERAVAEKTRCDKILDPALVDGYAREMMTALTKSVDQDDEQWKSTIPGKQVLAVFANKANIPLGRLKLLFLRQAQKADPNPFAEVIEIFATFAASGAQS